MKKLAVRLLCVLVSILMALSGLPAFTPVALAASSAANHTSDGFYWTKDETGVTITYYNGTGSDITVPSEIDGSSIVKIDYMAFCNTNIHSIIIPEGVCEIGFSAFSGCNKLANVSLPASLEAIGDGIFDNCSSLAAISLGSGNKSFCLDGYGVLYDAGKTRLIISPAVNPRKSYTVPGTVKSIDSAAFNNNTNLESISVPNTVTSIGGGVFFGCTSLKSFDIPDNIDIINGGMFWRCTSLESVTIPGGVKTIGQSAFYGCASLKNVTLPSALVKIELDAFGDSGLTSVTIPGATTEIDDTAFSYCDSIAKFTVSAGNTVFKSQAGVLFKLKNYDGDPIYALRQYPPAKADDTYIIPDGVTYLYPGSFKDCNNLTTVSIPESIGFADPNNPEYSNAADFCPFSKCTKLFHFLTPGSNNKFIEFGGLLYSKDKSYLYYYPMTKMDTTYQLPKQVKDMRCDFTDCKTIASFTVEAGNDSFFAQDGILYDMRGIHTDQPSDGQWITMFSYPQARTDETITIQPKIEYPEGSGRFYTLGHEVGAIAGNQYIKYAIYAPGNTTVGSFQFAGCSNLEQVDIPEGVKRIGLCVFFNCSKLKSITIPASVEVIEEEAFQHCSGLESIIFSGGSVATGSKGSAASHITNIGNRMFDGCSSLKSISLPGSVTDIGGSAFNGCSSLAAINVELSDDVYRSIGGVLYNKPCTTLMQYPAAKAGAAFAVPTTVKFIAEGAFAGCKNLTKIGIPPSVTSIDALAFSPNAKKCITIYGAAGSYAQKYAMSFGIPFSTAPLNCTVTFDSQQGSAVPSRTVLNGSTMTAPAAPTRTGFTFAGWYRDTAFTSAWNFTTDKVTANITLHAKWTKVINYTISAAVNNTAYGSVTGAGTYPAGTVVTLKAIPKAGYRFSRWLEGSVQASVSAVYQFTAAKNRTLTAEFLKIGTPVLSSAVSVGYNSIKLIWKAVPGANGYEIWRATADGAYTKVTAVKGVLSFTESNLTTNMLYYYKIKATCAAGTVVTYGALSAAQSARPIPATPAIAVASASYNSIRISWNIITGANGYEVCRATSLTGTYTKVCTVTSGTISSFTDTGLATNKAYYYKVRAYRMVGSAKVYGNYSTVRTTKPIPSAPGGVKVSVASATSLKVLWNKVAGATKYEVYRATSSGGAFSLAGTTSLQSWTNSGLLTGRTYWYKVRAYMLVGGKKVCGDFSVVVSAKP